MCVDSIKKIFSDIADSIRSCKKCNDKYCPEDMAGVIAGLGSGGGSAPTLETAEIYLDNNMLSSPIRVYYTALVNGEMVSTSTDETGTILPVVGTYISIEGANGVDNGNNVLEGIEHNGQGYIKWKVINAGSENIYLSDNPESGSSGIDPNETCNVGLLISGDVTFEVDYVTAENVGGMGTYYPVARKDNHNNETYVSSVNNVVKGTVIRIIGVEYCSLDYGEIEVIQSYDVGSTKGHYVLVNGSGDILIS